MQCFRKMLPRYNLYIDYIFFSFGIELCKNTACSCLRTGEHHRQYLDGCGTHEVESGINITQYLISSLLYSIADFLHFVK